MYTIMFRLCRQPSYWITVVVSIMLFTYGYKLSLPFYFLFLRTSLFQLIVAVGMGPVLALKYFRYTYRSSAINILQQAERSRGPIFSMGGLESQLKSLEKDVASLSTSQSKFRNSVYEPLLSASDPPTSTRRSIGPATFDFLQPAQSRLSSSYSRNCKDN